MDSDIEQKQALLKSEILDKNYDQEQFIQFCLGKKSNSDDLSQWSLSELHQIIEEFTQLQQSDNKISTNPPKEESKSEESIQNDVEQLKQAKTKIENKTTTTIVINCKKLEKGTLNEKKDLKVIIKNPKPIETGFLSSNYVNYEVETAVMEWLVRRRYSDFEWLRTVLIKFNPGRVVPPLPNKKIGSRRFEVDFIEKRMMFLQNSWTQCY